MPVKKLKNFLDKNNIKYISIKHSLAYTAQGVAASAHIHGKDIAKTLMVKLDGKMAMAVLSANDKLDLEVLKKKAGKKEASLASESEFQSLFPECAIGAMPPFGNLYGMEVYLSDTLINDKDIFFNAGSHTELIKLSFKDYKELVKPKVLKLTR